MNKFYVLLMLVGLSSCGLGLPAGQLPTMSLTNQQIRVGETTTLTFTMPAKLFQSGNPDVTTVGWAFIFSSNSETLKPYIPVRSGTGFTPESDPQLFPVADIVEVTNPLAPNNVPPLQQVVIENGLAKGVFELKGKSVGTARIKASFLNSSVQFPNNYQELLYGNSTPGSILIEVVP